jgi:hypothetical protein
VASSNGVVHELAAEYGEVTSLGLTLDEFLERSRTEPLEMLGLHPLWSFLDEGANLEPGFVLQAAPPFCMKSAVAVSLRPILIEQAIPYLADLARQLHDVRDGQTIRLTTKQGRLMRRWQPRSHASEMQEG